MKNIHILPTDKPSNLLFEKISNRYYTNSRRKENSKNVQNQNIYITSDEEIKEGDWFIFGEEILKCTGYYSLTQTSYVKCNKGDCSSEICKKIILTTDQDLIDDGVQAITDEFLKWLVMNPTCEEVEVVRDSKQSTDSNGFLYIEWLDYKIIIPKEEPTSCACGANTSCQCEEPKEKTFEEILSKMTLVNPKHLRMTSNGHGEFPDGYMLTEDGIKYILKKLKNN